MRLRRIQGSVVRTVDAAKLRSGPELFDLSVTGGQLAEVQFDRTAFLASKTNDKAIELKLSYFDGSVWRYMCSAEYPDGQDLNRAGLLDTSHTLTTSCPADAQKIRIETNFRVPLTSTIELTTL